MNGPELRLESDGDGEFLRRLFLATHAHLAVLPPEFAEMQMRAQRMQYESAFPDAERYIVSVEGTDVGNLIVDRSEEGIRLIDVGLLPEFRNSGLGAQILQGLIAEGKRIILHVAVDNPAKRLYERLGFVEQAGDNAMYCLMVREPTSD